MAKLETLAAWGDYGRPESKVAVIEKLIEMAPTQLVSGEDAFLKLFAGSGLRKPAAHR